MTIVRGIPDARLGAIVKAYAPRALDVKEECIDSATKPHDRLGPAGKLFALNLCPCVKRIELPVIQPTNQLNATPFRAKFTEVCRHQIYRSPIKRDNEATDALTASFESRFVVPGEQTFHLTIAHDKDGLELCLK